MQKDNRRKQFDNSSGHDILEVTLVVKLKGKGKGSKVESGIEITTRQMIQVIQQLIRSLNVAIVERLVIKVYFVERDYGMKSTIQGLSN